MKPNQIYGHLMASGGSAKAIAKTVGLSENFVRKVINRDRKSEAVETAIAKALGKTREEVFGDEPVKTKHSQAA